MRKELCIFCTGLQKMHRPRASERAPGQSVGYPLFLVAELIGGNICAVFTRAYRRVTGRGPARGPLGKALATPSSWSPRCSAEASVQFLRRRAENTQARQGGGSASVSLGGQLP